MKTIKAVALVCIFVVFSCPRGIAQQNTSEYLSYALKLTNESKYELAIDVCNKILKINQEISDVIFLKGFNNLKLENFDDAISDFDKALELDSDYADAYYYRGIALLESGNFLGGVRDLNRARKRNPTLTFAFMIREIFHASGG